MKHIGDLTSQKKMTLDDIKNGGNNRLDNMKNRHEKRMKQLSEEKNTLEN